MQAIQRRLTSCQKALSQWSRNKLGQAENKLKEKMKQLENLMKNEGTGKAAVIKQLLADINDTTGKTKLVSERR
jgi:hypothetical protein